MVNTRGWPWLTAAKTATSSACRACPAVSLNLGTQQKEQGATRATTSCSVIHPISIPAFLPTKKTDAFRRLQNGPRTAPQVIKQALTDDIHPSTSRDYRRYAPLDAATPCSELPSNATLSQTGILSVFISTPSPSAASVKHTRSHQGLKYVCQDCLSHCLQQKFQRRRILFVEVIGMNIHKLQYEIAPGLSRNRDDNRPLAQVDPGIALEPIIGWSHNVTIPVCPDCGRRR